MKGDPIVPGDLWRDGKMLFMILKARRTDAYECTDNNGIMGYDIVWFDRVGGVTPPFYDWQPSTFFKYASVKRIGYA